MKFLLLWIGLCLSTFPLIVQTVECETTTQDERWYSNLSVVIHHNGQVDPCGSIGSGSIDDNFVKTLSASENKYEMETRLTDGFSTLLDKNDVSTCGSDFDGFDDDDMDVDDVNINNEHPESLYSHCDRGPELTPILLDHQSLIKTEVHTLPCRFYTREGLRIQTLEQLKTMTEKARLAPSQLCANPQDGDLGASSDNHCDEVSSPSLTPSPEIHLYAVPAGRVFHFAPAFVGELFELDHLTLMPDDSKPIVLKVLSTNPKVLDILNVFTKEEAGAVVQRALAETSPTHKIKRSTTSGSSSSNANVFSKRTSENAFDTSGTIAMALKKRIFEVLGYDEYWHGHDDGLQVLRYNLTTAYVPHMDYLPRHLSSEFNYDSHKKGGNRYATVLLYMSDIPERGGGETVFERIWPEGGKRQRHKDALKELRASGDADRAGIVRDSWEEQMVATCRSKFSVKPYAGRAVLFYSQHPNGEEDKMSVHGGCPVLKGDKWAANLWVWNTPRENYVGAPMRDGVTAKAGVNRPQQIHASFQNSGRDESMKNAELYYDEAMFWGKLTPGESALTANTYEGHRWNVKVDGNVVKSWVIGDQETQKFIF